MIYGILQKSNQVISDKTFHSSDISSKTVVLCNKVLCTWGMLFCMMQIMRKLKITQTQKLTS